MAEEKAAGKKKEIKLSKEKIKLRQAIKRVAKTADGQLIFRHLMQECGFATSSIVMDTQTSEINANSTIYMEARKTIYYHFRNLIPPENLQKIEYGSTEEMED